MEILMNRSYTPSMPSARKSKPSAHDLAIEEEKRRLVEMLEAGIRSVKAGRVYSQDEVRRRVDEAFAKRAAERASKKKST
jgi:predicted transcriptional regulator